MAYTRTPPQVSGMTYVPGRGYVRGGSAGTAPVSQPLDYSTTPNQYPTVYQNQGSFDEIDRAMGGSYDFSELDTGATPVDVPTSMSAQDWADYNVGHKQFLDEMRARREQMLAETLGQHTGAPEESDYVKALLGAFGVREPTDTRQSQTALVNQRAAQALNAIDTGAAASNVGGGLRRAARERYLQEILVPTTASIEQDYATRMSDYDRMRLEMAQKYGQRMDDWLVRVGQLGLSKAQLDQLDSQTLLQLARMSGIEAPQGRLQERGLVFADEQARREEEAARRAGILGAIGTIGGAAIGGLTGVGAAYVGNQ